MRYLVDTNVLTRLAQPESQAASQAFDAIDQLGRLRLQKCIVPQVIYEYWVVATRPTENNGLGLTTAQAASDVERILGMFPLLPDGRDIYSKWHQLVTSVGVSGKAAHDARLVAAMNGPVRNFVCEGDLTATLSPFPQMMSQTHGRETSRTS